MMRGRAAWTEPYATLAAARDAVRALKKAGKMPTGGVTVSLRGGTYLCTSTFALGAEDSGTPEARIIYRAYPGEQVRLMGGRSIDRFAPVTDPSILNRLDAAARGQVLQRICARWA